MLMNNNTKQAIFNNNFNAKKIIFLVYLFEIDPKIDKIAVK